MLYKNIFKFSLYLHIKKIRSAPWRPCFSMDQNNLKNLGKSSPKEHFWKIIYKTRLVEKIFKDFAFSPFFWCRSNQSSSWNQILWTTFDESHLRNLPVKILWNQTNSFRDEDLNGRQTDASRWMITIDHLEHFMLCWANKNKNMYTHHNNTISNYFARIRMSRAILKQ